jgi:hypothetical protein
MTNHNTCAILQTFAEKVGRLEASSLKRFLSAEGWKMSWDLVNDRLATDGRMPEIEHLEAYILNLRFFIQNNELISLQNMDALYQSECANPEFLKQFQEVRDAMNRALDHELWFRFNDQRMTYSMLFRGMIYTRLAHASKEKHKLFDQMTTHPLGLAMAMNEFLKCICVVHAALVFINRLNGKAFPDMSKS